MVARTFALLTRPLRYSFFMRNKYSNFLGIISYLNLGFINHDWAFKNAWILSKEEYEKMREKIIIPQSNVLDKLKELKIDLSKLVLLTDLTTERMEIEYKKYTLVIDKNYFRNRVDYNVEVESFTRKAAKIYLLKHILPFGITYKKGYVSKSRRAIYNL